MDYKALLQLAITSAFKGGEEILKVYDTDFSVETKIDKTPVTLADKASSSSIINILEGAGIPIISEEEEVKDYAERKNWDYFWIVDPLDGTKEFIKRNGEFAVNIALIKNDKPVIGVIYAPAFDDLYFACSGMGSYKINLPKPADYLKIPEWFEKMIGSAQKLPLQKIPEHYTVVASRSYLSREVNLHIEKLKALYGVVNIIYAGSSIKQCWVAEGRAHEYPRFGTTMEWDTAAGQCILEQAGKKLIDLETGLPMRYNKESMSNHFFTARY